MERRRAERIKQRLTCELVMADRRHPGIVLDLSETGLFVQTSTSLPPGEMIRVKLRCPGEADVEVEACVARKYVVPHQLISVAHGGVGLRIESASTGYLNLVAATGKTDVAAPPPPPPAAPPPPSNQGSAYRVRAKQTSGSRSRTLRVTAPSEEEARRMASAKLDQGWEILGVDPVPA